MLTHGIASKFNSAVEARVKSAKAQILSESRAAKPEGSAAGLPTAFSVDLGTFLNDPDLKEEIFGPTTMLIHTGGLSDMIAAASVLHGHLTATIAGTEEDLASCVPIPTAIVSTSPGRYQVLWQVEGFTLESQERVLKLLAIMFGGDPACTDCNRVLRLPGFLNRKYDPAHPVGVEYLTDSTFNPTDFRLDISDPIDAAPVSRIRHGKGSGKRTNSEHDWAWVVHELTHGQDAGNLTRALAERRPDKPNPLYYAQRTVDVASARLWLIKGVPFEDVITMLQVRRRS